MASNDLLFFLLSVKLDNRGQIEQTFILTIAI